MAVWQQVSDHLKADRSCVLVSVLKCRGSVPRETGAHMIVLSDGSFSGTIGGGALEWEAIQEARRHLTELSGPAHSIHAQSFALGPGLGQCCGGSVVLGFEKITPSAGANIHALVKLERAGPFECLLRLDGKGGFDRHILSSPGSGSLGLLKDEGQFIESFGERRRHLYLFGAGHVGQALMLALATLPFSVKWIDPRATQFPKAVPANFECIVSNNPKSQLDHAPRGSMVLVMTHSHPLDLEITRSALIEPRFAYVGLIGSKTKRARFASQMLKSGLTEKQLSSLVCPIGVPGIRSKKPAAIAAATAAQLLCVDEALGEERSGDAGMAVTEGTRVG
ncbi:MAG: xanthine dehydrogenase accessory protein XdhC [Stappiaceae bacterium]